MMDDMRTISIDNTIVLIEFLQTYLDSLLTCCLYKIIIKSSCFNLTSIKQFLKILKSATSLKQLIIIDTDLNSFTSLIIEETLDLPCLEELDIKMSCKMKSVNCSLPNPLKVSHSLVQLTLNDFNFCYNSICHIALFIRESHVLNSVDLTSCNIDDLKSIILSESLAFNQEISVVRLYCNFISDIGFKSLLETIKINKSLKYLYASSNKIECRFTSITELINFNSLSTIKLSENYIDSQGLISLIKSVRVAENLNHLNLEMNLVCQYSLDKIKDLSGIKPEIKL